jgi:hypothetical protein
MPRALAKSPLIFAPTATAHGSSSYDSIGELDSPRPSTVTFLRARSSEISGILEFAQHSPHSVPAYAFTWTRATLQQVRQRPQANLPTIGFCDQPSRDTARVELQASIIDQCT